MLANMRSIPGAFLRPVEILRSYHHENLVPDLLAGLTVGVVLLPQGLAFSLLAGLPPAMGLYAAIMASIFAALWGSSNHLQTGPTNTAAALTLSVLLPIAAPGSAEFIAAAGLIAVMAGIFRLVLGLARLGLLVNFVSDSVIVGFTAGAGMLIMVGQITTLLRVQPVQSTNLPGILSGVVPQFLHAHLPTLILSIVTIALLIILRRVNKRLPMSLVAIVAMTAIVWGFNLKEQGIRVLGEVPSGLPPLADLPLLNLNLIGRLSTGALAIAAIGLVEATAIARALSSNSGQRLDSNQEFVGQGIANIAAGFFSGYPCSASFNRSALSYRTGARTSLASAFAGLFVLLASFILAPAVAQLPRAVISAELVLAAYSMIDRNRMRRIWKGNRNDAAIMITTFVATLLLPLQFAVLIGILMSLGAYILQTSAPQVVAVLPDDQFRHWGPQPHKPQCPQLGILDVLGDLYFGAVSHVEESIHRHMNQHPEQRFLLLRMHSVQRIDISGINALENLLRSYRSRGGDIYMTRVREPVLHLMQTSGFQRMLGADHYLSEDTAIDFLFHKVIDPAVCIYECSVRAFRECQNLPKRDQHLDIPLQLLPARPFPEIAPRILWERIRSPDAPLLIDVREPREYKQGHIPNSRLIPLATLLTDVPALPGERDIVLVCRSGRRSMRAAAALQARGYQSLSILQGGMLAWENSALLQAVD